MKISRQAYSDMYGPTTGDRLRLADTELWIEIEADRTHYGDEVKFGGGKVIRDGMGQSQASREVAVDTVITNAVIIDHWGIIKADVGLKDGRIHAIGKAGNPAGELLKVALFFFTQWKLNNCPAFKMCWPGVKRLGRN